MSLNYPGRKAILSRNMSQGRQGAQKLLEMLSVKELAILQRYPNLVKRVYEIEDMKQHQLIKELEKEFGLEVDCMATGNMFVSPSKSLDFLPEWINGPTSEGWNVGNLWDFMTWAETLLMQEVRINVWIRYIEYKKGAGPISNGRNELSSGARGENAGYLYI